MTDLIAAAAAGALSTESARRCSSFRPCVCSHEARLVVLREVPAVPRSARVARGGVAADRTVRRGGLRSRCCRCSFFSPPSCQRSRPVVPAPHRTGIKLPTGSCSECLHVSLPSYFPAFLIETFVKSFLSTTTTEEEEEENPRVSS